MFSLFPALDDFVWLLPTGLDAYGGGSREPARQKLEGWGRFIANACTHQHKCVLQCSQTTGYSYRLYIVEIRALLGEHFGCPLRKTIVFSFAAVSITASVDGGLVVRRNPARPLIRGGARFLRTTLCD